MAGEHPLVLNRFSKKQAAASTGAMARVQKAQRVSFCDLAEITRGTYVRVTDGSEEQVEEILSRPPAERSQSQLETLDTLFAQTTFFRRQVSAAIVGLGLGLWLLPRL